MGRNTFIWGEITENLSVLQKVQTSSHKVSNGNVMYSIVTLVNNSILHI